MALNTVVAPPLSAPRLLWAAQAGASTVFGRLRRQREILVVLTAQFVIYSAMLVAALWLV